MKSTGLALLAAGLVLSGAGSLSAESINPPTMPQTAPMNKQEKKNLDMVLEWWRVVIQNRDLDATSKYQAEDYIQHNPNVPTGRAAFVAYFGRRQPQPIPETLAVPPVKAFAKGDYVALVWEHEDKDPGDPAKTYKYNSFDVVRLQNGKIQEHWDEARKNAPAPAAASARFRDRRLVVARAAASPASFASSGLDRSFIASRAMSVLLVTGPKPCAAKIAS